MIYIPDLIAELAHLCAIDRNPFPFDDCNKLIEGADAPYSALIPDLDFYLSELAGYRSHGEQIVTWDDEKIAGVKGRIARTFIERYPTYKDLIARVTADQFRDLHATLQIAERTRVIMDALLSEVQRTREPIP